MNAIAVIRVAKIVGLVGFILPWMVVSCSNQPIMTASGVDLAIGNFTFHNPMNGQTESHRGEPNILIIVAALAAVGGLAASFSTAVRDAVAGLAVSSGAALVLAWIGLNMARSAITGQLAGEAARQGSGMSLQGLLSFQTKLGFAVTELGFAVALGVALFAIWARRAGGVPEDMARSLAARSATLARSGLERAATVLSEERQPPAAGTSRFCSACGAAVLPDARFCGSCGKAVTAPSSPAAEEEAAVASPAPVQSEAMTAEPRPAGTDPEGAADTPASAFVAAQARRKRQGPSGGALIIMVVGLAAVGAAAFVVVRLRDAPPIDRIVPPAVDAAAAAAPAVEDSAARIARIDARVTVGEQVDRGAPAADRRTFPGPGPVGLHAEFSGARAGDLFRVVLETDRRPVRSCDPYRVEGEAGRTWCQMQAVPAGNHEFVLKINDVEVQRAPFSVGSFAVTRVAIRGDVRQGAWGPDVREFSGAQPIGVIFDYVGATPGDTVQTLVLRDGQTVDFCRPHVLQSSASGYWCQIDRALETGRYSFLIRVNEQALRTEDFAIF